MKEWLKNAVFYEIYPQSFRDTNGDGIGDFDGIIEKLDYIKDMGFTAIWMNPCFDSPFTDAGYDVRDFYKTAARYGTNEDLKRLFDEVHKRDMHILLDLVAGHTSIDCEWFKESMKAERNQYTDRYVWTDEIWKSMDGIPCIAGCLRGISDRNGGAGVNFYSTQPALNYGFAKITETWQQPVDSEGAISTREELLNIIRFWLGLGCDGFRVDMAANLVKNDDEQEETIKLWRKIFAVVNDEFPEAVFVSEWGNPKKALSGGFDMDFLLQDGPSHYNDMFHSNEPFFSKEGKGTAAEFFKHYMECTKETAGKGQICLPSGNHDIPRISYYCDDVQRKLVYAFMMSMPTVPFIYYGDEIGMKYLPGLKSVEGGYSRTGTRTPMQWDNSTNCGFSSAKPADLYIMQDPDENRPTVDAQMADKNSVLNELKKQIAVRKANTVLQERAGFEIVNDGYPLIYKRSTPDKCVLVVINPCDKECKHKYNLSMGKTIYELNGAAYTEGGYIVAPSCSASYIEIENV